MRSLYSHEYHRLEIGVCVKSSPLLRDLCPSRSRHACRQFFSSARASATKRAHDKVSAHTVSRKIFWTSRARSQYASTSRETRMVVRPLQASRSFYSECDPQASRPTVTSMHRERGVPAYPALFLTQQDGDERKCRGRGQRGDQQRIQRGKWSCCCIWCWDDCVLPGATFSLR